MTDWLPLLMAGLSGLVLGSFAVTAGVRFSRAEPITAGRSRCDDCGHTLGFAQTIPVVSYVRLRGACAHCRAPIDRLHLAGEVAGAVVVASAIWVAEPLRAIPIAAIGLALVGIAAADLKSRRIPDLYTAIVAVAGLTLAGADGFARVQAGLLAAAGSILVLSLLREAGRRARGDPGLGWGDVKLMAALALWLGAGTPAMVLVASVAGLLAVPVLRGADGRLPFGPMIGLGAWIVGVAAEGGWTPWAL